MRSSVVVCLVVAVCALSVCASALENTNVLRTIDLTTAVVRVGLEIQLSNKGSAPATSYTVAVPASLAETLAFVDAFTPDDDVLDVSPIAAPSNANPGDVFYGVTLEEPLGKGKTTEFTVALVFVDALTPFPQSIAQSEKQHVLYFDNHFVYTPYKTVKQRTVVKLPSSSVESHTTEKPTSMSGSSLTYGPYKNVDAFAASEMKVHFENNAPFVTATSMVKEFEVSHWGANLAVEEHYSILHTGAKLSGAFSRYDYQRNPSAYGAASVRSITAVLPATASDVYYRDVIGNISTSRLRQQAHQVEVEMEPRFPLFGGWKTQFYMGYNTPLSSVLSVVASTGQYLLTLDMSGAFPEVPVADATIRVLLPEGASDVAIHSPLNPEPPVSFSLRKTYLDTSGRVVVEFPARMLVNDQDLTFQVTYSLSTLSLLAEPFLLSAAFMALFLFAMVYVRIDLTLTPSGASAAADEASIFATRVEQASSALIKLDNALATWANTSDNASFAAARKAHAQAFSSALNDAKAIVSAASHPDHAKTMASVVSSLESRFSLFGTLANNQSQFFSGELAPDALNTRNKSTSDRYFGLASDIDAALDALQ